MARQSYAQALQSGRLMVAGLEQNSAQVVKLGLSKEFIRKIHDTVNTAQNLESDQEILKTKLQEKTTAFSANMVELAKQLSEAKRVIKLKMAQESWKEFGIEERY